MLKKIFIMHSGQIINWRKKLTMANDQWPYMVVEHTNVPEIII